LGPQTCAQSGGAWNTRLRRCTGIGMRGLGALEDLSVGKIALIAVGVFLAYKYLGSRR
jgi:hypothetical protein